MLLLAPGSRLCLLERHRRHVHARANRNHPDFHAITGSGLSGLRITEGLHPWRKGPGHPHGPPLISFVPPSFLLAPISNSPQRYCSSSSVTRNPSLLLLPPVLHPFSRETRPSPLILPLSLSFSTDATRVVK